MLDHILSSRTGEAGIAGQRKAEEATAAPPKSCRLLPHECEQSLHTQDASQ